MDFAQIVAVVFGSHKHFFADKQAQYQGGDIHLTLSFLFPAGIIMESSRLDVTSFINVFATSGALP
jgi:hypothetical protein